MPTHIDWQSTGAMLQGIGTIVGVVTVLLAALIGRSTFKSWKQQKVEERMMDVAERVLVLTYKLDDGLKSARSRLMFEREREAAAAKLAKELPSFPTRDHAERQRMITAQVMLDRLTMLHSEWDEMWALKPLVLAYFGKELQEALQAFWTFRASLIILAQDLAEDDGRDRSRAAHIRRELYGGEGDTVGLAMEQAVGSIEAALVLKLRTSTQSAKG
jgi:hypothetical protein